MALELGWLEVGGPGVRDRLAGRAGTALRNRSPKVCDVRIITAIVNHGQEGSPKMNAENGKSVQLEQGQRLRQGQAWAG